MIQTAQALQDFFSSFGIPAYVTGNVPDIAAMPYITYDLTNPEPLAHAMFHASVWYRDTSVIAVSEKCDEIEAAIGNGLSIPTESGVIYLFRDRNTPFAQLQNDPNPQTKRMYLTMVINCYSN